MTRGSAVLALSLLIGCKGGGDLAATGSQTIATSADRTSIYALNAEDGTLSAMGPGGAVREIQLGAEPSRIARAGDRVFVTLAGEGKVVELEETKDGLEQRARHAVGSEPAGIVASPDGKLVYVAITLEDRVEERDAETFEVLRSFAVQDQPRWLAMHPSGRAVFAASTVGGTITRIDLESGNTTEIDMPVTSRDTVDGSIDLGPRLTGDPAITPDGTAIAFPSLYVDNTTPVEEPTDNGSVSNGYASTGLSVSRMNPALVTFELDKNGAVTAGSGKAVFAGAVGRNGGIVRSMPTAVVAGPDGSAWLVALEGSDAVLLVSRSAFRGQGNSPTREFGGGGETFDTDTDCFDCEERTVFTSLGDGGFWERPILVIDSAGGPRGLAFTDDDTVWIHDWLGRDVRELGYSEALPALEEIARGDFPDDNPAAGGRTEIATSSLPEDVERGRLLFNSAIDNKMVTDGAGVSCATCHIGGRSDGIVWTFESGQRNTLSLVGGIAATAPFTWEGTVDSVADEAEITSQGRMGGNRITPRDLADIAAYVEWTRPVDAPASDRDADRIALGKEIFERPEVACATCHAGERLTDNLNHEVIDFEAQTPSLIGVVATAPYFHDGSARNLRVVLDFARDGGMGNTGSLSESEMDALEAYLRSL
jgi:mono/diheme cytochrome c family protein/streptogramin lyase